MAFVSSKERRVDETALGDEDFSTVYMLTQSISYLYIFSDQQVI